MKCVGRLHNNLCSKIMSAIMTKVNFSSIWKPSFWLPNMSLACYCVNNCHPPIIAHKNHHAYHPFTHYPHKVPHTKKNHIQASMLIWFIWQLYLCAATFWAFYINSHNIPPFDFILFYPTLSYLSISFSILSYNTFEVIKWNP